MSNSQLEKLKSGIKNETEVTSSNVIDNSNDKCNFPHKLLITDTRVSRLRKSFAKNASVNIKLSKTQLHKIGISAGSLDRLLEPLLKTDSPFMKNELKPLA